MALEKRSRVRHTFRALMHRQFRVFWVGQAVSVTGTWMQTMALSWLVYRLTDSPLVLGILAVARFGPSLVGSPVAGVVSDRFPRRNVVLLTQACSLLQASTLAVLTLTGAVQVWQVLVLAAFQGAVDTLDMPARQSLQVDLVGLADLQSAVSLNSSAFNLARMLGPAAAGVIVSAWGEGVCFALNALSYLAVLLALLAIRLPRSTPARASSLLAQLGEGLAFGWRHAEIRAVLLAVAVTSALGMSYSTLLPVLARDVLRGGVRGYGLLLAGAGLGAIAGALGTAARFSGRGGRDVMLTGQGLLGVALLALAAARALPLAVGCMVVAGFAVAVQLATTNAFLQTEAPAAMRGRILSLYFWVFTGLNPLGGLAAGWLAEHAGAVATTAVAGAGCLGAALFAALVARRRAVGARTA